MNETFMNLTLDNLDTEHICCAISDKKHQVGVSVKKQWLKKRIEEGHVIRKLDQKGKVFIEYAPIEQHGFLFLEKIICIFTVFG